ncbi:hypothetical protein [Halorientalis marina]|jgi:hypothetical protein|uniref:hypothetical protein n=1 Tax=Halorientalis marina TaxID=2931976 RepID=UPI001FF5EA34|nr:hypothetical protein [Halorientalis marina]
MIDPGGWGGAAAPLSVAGLAPVTVLVIVVLGTPPLVAAVAMGVRRQHRFQYSVAAAGALVAVFALTGTVGFATHWTVLSILAILAAIGGHVSGFREDGVDLLIAGAIYATPIALGVVLLLGTAGVFSLPV